MKNRSQKFLAVFIVAAVAFSGTGCLVVPCKDCHEAQGGTNDMRTQKRQEILAREDMPYQNKTGLIHGFKAQASVETPVVYKDLSLHYNFEEKKPCPLGLQSAHSNITAGPNMNFKSAGGDVYGEGSHKPGAGFQAGVQTVYRFSDKFSFVPGLLFKQNNAKEEAEITDGGEPPYNTTSTVEDKYSYSYLSVPLLAQFNLTESLSLSAGPEVNYLLGSKVKSNTSYPGQSHSETTKLTKESVRLGVGVQAGVKYDISKRWAVELLYDHRLSRLNKKHPAGYPNYELPAWRMKSVQLSAKCRICDLVRGERRHSSKNNN